MNIRVKNFVFYFYKLLKREICLFLFPYFKKTIAVQSIFAGSEYGGFYYIPYLIDHDSVVLSFGLGEDISFDVFLIEKHNCKVLGFDPTPKAIDYINKICQNYPNFHFFQYGLGEKTNYQTKFFLPKDEKFISGSILQNKIVSHENFIEVPILSLSDIIIKHQIKRIDILKIDIEGSEFEIINSIIDNRKIINQLAIEFHPRFFKDGMKKLSNSLKLLNENGFHIFNYTLSLNEISFININNIKI